MRHQAISVLLAGVASVSGTIQLPALSGSYPVGTVSFELIDYNRLDAAAPTPMTRDLMLSVFYPTSESAVKSGNYNVTRYFPTPEVAAYFDLYVGNSSEVLEIITQSYDQAPINNADFPVLIFSPGLGGSRLLYQALLENLASRGWIVIGVDHPFDALVIEYPDGRINTYPPSILDDFPSQMPFVVQLRVQDVHFIAQSLTNATVLAQIPGLDGRALRTDQIGIGGHSLGGNTAAQAIANFSVFPCGINFDGGIFGPVAETGLDKPFVMIEAENHPSTTDGTLAEFWYKLYGFRRLFMVNGTVHISFMDAPILRDLLGDAMPVDLRNQSGTVAGAELLKINTAFLEATYAACLTGNSTAELDALAQGEFPEVYVPENPNSTVPAT